MSMLKDLIAQKEALELQISEIKKTELSETILKVQAIIAEFELTPDQVFPKAQKTKVTKTTATKNPVRYKEPVSGKTWTGHGTQPNWLVGKDRSEFAV